MTAAHVMGLDAEGIDNAIGIVVNLAPTCMAWANEEGNTVKWLIGGSSLHDRRAGRGDGGARYQRHARRRQGLDSGNLEGLPP